MKSIESGAPAPLGLGDNSLQEGRQQDNSQHHDASVG